MDTAEITTIKRQRGRENAREKIVNDDSTKGRLGQ